MYLVMRPSTFGARSSRSQISEPQPMTAILSFNEFTASLFVTSHRTQTLPVAMYNYVREYADPSMAALSVIFIAVTAALLTLANRYLGLSKVLNVEEPR